MLIILLTLSVFVNANLVNLTKDEPCFCDKIYLIVHENNYWKENTGTGELIVNSNATIISGSGNSNATIIDDNNVNNSNFNINSGVSLARVPNKYSVLSLTTFLYNSGVGNVINSGVIDVEQDTNDMNKPPTQYYG